MSSTIRPPRSPVLAGISPSRSARSRRRWQMCEALEPRTLLSVTATSYTINNVQPTVGTYDSAGDLWVVDAAFQTGGPFLQEISSSNQIMKTIDISSTSPNWITYASGHIYMSDGGSPGGIDDVNISTGIVTQYQFANGDPSLTPYRLTVSGNGDVWFTAESIGEDIDGNPTNTIGRWTPGSATADYFTLPGSTNDSTAVDIASAGSDSVWVGMNGVDSLQENGANHLVQVTFAGGSYSSTVYAINTGDPVADANNYLQYVTSDGSGGVWFTLSNAGTPSPFDSQRTQTGADRLVHASFVGGTLVESGFAVPGSSGSNALDIGFPSVDAQGHVWFAELDGSNVDYFDPSTSNFTITPYPDGANQGPDQLIANPAASEATVLTFTDDGEYVRAVIQNNTITFNGSTSNPSAVQGQAINNFTLAIFTAPPLASGNYTATVNWGDGSATSVVTATPIGNNQYEVIVSGKTFAQQGTYSGTINITDPSNSPVGSLSFQSAISDIPLNVSSFAGVDVLAGIAAAAGTFTDDPNLPVSTWTATINWGDGSTSTALIVRDPASPGTYLIVGLHVYKKAGTYTLTLLVSTTEQDALITNNSLTATLKVK